MSLEWPEYFAVIRRGDYRSALRLIDAALDRGDDLDALYLEVLQPAMREVGRLWQENEMTVADEHLATAITQTVMAHLFSRRVAAVNQSGPRIIAACVDTERHEIGLRMLCDLLEMRGWDVTYLGATVPIESLIAMTRTRQPDVIALSATIAPHLPRVRHTIQAIRAELGADTPILMVGGRPFLDHPEMATRVGADLTASDAREAVASLVRMTATKLRAG